MNHSVYELREFYKGKAGSLVRRLLVRHIREMWPDIAGLRLMGCGYAVPYLRTFINDAERVFGVMPERLGVHFWPEGEPGRVCLAGDAQLPFETASIDRVLLVHGFEHAPQPGPYLDELWRVMKSNGRLLLVVPNRLGLWTRAEWTPFGHGMPYSRGQVKMLLRQHHFVHERTENALYMPPFRSPLVLRTAYQMENVGRYIMPGLAGVHMIECSKQIYGGLAQRVSEQKTRRILVPDAVPT